MDNNDTDKTAQEIFVQDDNDSAEVRTLKETLREQFETLKKQAVDKELKKIKTSLDKMAEERDKAVKEKVRLEEERRENEIKRLETEGKTTEALQIQLTAAKENNKILNERLDRVTRDQEVTRALTSFRFRNAKMAGMAQRDIVGQLVKDSDGTWVHSSGASIAEFVSTYLEQEENAPLLEEKRNSGTNPTNNDSPPPLGKKAAKPSSVVGLSGLEVIELARLGQLPGRKRL
jgi:hypothetical protein